MVLVQHAPGHPVKCHLEMRAGNAAVPGQPPPISARPRPPPPETAKHWALYLEEILRYDGQALRVVGDALEVRVLIEDVVINVQEELEGVLVQEVDLEGRG